MGLLTGALPCDVDVNGERVAIDASHRTGLLVEQAGWDTPKGRMEALRLSFEAPDGTWPRAVVDDPAAACDALARWHARGWDAMRYGRASRGRAPRGRLLDWDADAAVVAADFQRLYGIDLLDPDCKLHWWRFCALMQAAVRSEGSLLRRAMAARLPAPAGLKGDRLKAHEAERAAWALPPTAAEELARARARAYAEFARG